jgi:hypothetical protein
MAEDNTPTKLVEEIDKLLYEHLKEIKTPGTVAYNKKKELDFQNKYYQNLEPLPDDSIYHNQIVSFLIEDLGLSTEEAEEYLTKLVDKQFEVPNANKTGISIKEFEKIKNITDTPTNVVDDVVVGIDRSGKEATVLVDENGYVELFRATDNPERLVISDFTKQGDIQSAGLGTQNYFATNAPYANKYTGTNKKLYKFSTNIKPNEILDISPVSLKNKHPELYTLIFGENEIRNTKAIQDNIETIKELGYKAIGNRETGSTGLLEVAQYEIIPLTTANETYNIKPIATLQTKEGFAAGKSPEAFIETSLDTPTNVVDDILKTQLDDIRILNDSGVSDQVDNIMAKKINDLYQTDGDIESFSKYLDNLTPDTFTETNKIKSILGFGKTGTGMRVTSRSINDGIGSRSPIIFDESRIDDLGYVTWKNLQHEYGSFQPSPNNVDGFELVKNLVNEGNEINFESMTDVVIPDTPTNVVDDVVMNKSEAIDNIDNLIDELPLEEAFKKQVKKNTARIGKNVATPGGIIDFIDAWELGVLALGVTAIATGEIDEIPTIMYNQGVKMYNNMLSSVGLPVQVEEKPYNINFEKAINTFNIAEMFMPTAYVEKAAVKEFKKGQEAGIDISVGLGAGVGVPPMQFKTEQPKEDTGNINSIMTNLMSNISNAQKSYPITADEIGTFGRNPINVVPEDTRGKPMFSNFLINLVPEDTKDKPVKVDYDSKEKQNLHDIYANLYTKLSNASARVE